MSSWQDMQRYRATKYRKDNILVLDEENENFPPKKNSTKGDGKIYSGPIFSCAIGAIICENRAPLTGKQLVSATSLFTELAFSDKRMRLVDSLNFKLLVDQDSCKNYHHLSEIFSSYVQIFKKEADLGTIRDSKKFRNFTANCYSITSEKNNDEVIRKFAIDNIMTDCDFLIVLPDFSKKNMDVFMEKPNESEIDIRGEAFYAYMQAMQKSLPMYIIWKDGEISENKMIL